MCFDMKYIEHPDACTGQVICVYVAVIAAVCNMSATTVFTHCIQQHFPSFHVLFVQTMMSELMISTVLINSEHNLCAERTPRLYRLILLVIRPFVWVLVVLHRPLGSLLTMTSHVVV